MQSQVPQGQAIEKAVRAFIAPLLILFTFAALALPLAVVAMPESVRIPQLEEHDEESALFSHWEHEQFKCYACHTSIFPQTKVGFTHDDMDKGKFCAACHDGKTAWAVDDDDTECETCHVEK